MTRSGRGLRTLFAAFMFIGVAACGEERAGTPRPSSDVPESGQPTSTTSAAPTTTSGGGGLEGVDPCALLTEAERAQLSLPVGQPDTLGGDPVCNWNRGSNTGIVQVTVNTNTGIDDLSASNATKVEDIVVGAHQARRLEFPEGNCNIDVAVTSQSSITVSALVGGSIADACALTQQTVALVEPKLPRG